MQPNLFYQIDFGMIRFLRDRSAGFAAATQRDIIRAGHSWQHWMGFVALEFFARCNYVV